MFFLFFCGKETKESRPKEKLQFFRVGATISDTATVLPS